MWPFKQQQVAEIKLPFPNAIFRQAGQGWEYTPQKDITAYEVSLLLPVFIGRNVDGVGYLEKHNLFRHFTKIEV